MNRCMDILREVKALPELPDTALKLLQVVNDPGVPVVYAGFALMIAGLFVVFYVSPWMAARVKKT